ncbi:MAG: glycosyltransferase, partial [Verrucomicrobia bacterium]|nr:glycosyltransferase [Verrucomicrobiota bacterium]
MRIVLDLQEAQNESRFRAAGRYSLALARAIAREASRNEVWVLLSGRFPHSIEPLRAQFTDLIPLERIRVVELPGPVAEFEPVNAWRMLAAELIREKFLADLRPDIVHNSTLLEGWSNEVVASTPRLNPAIPSSATIYDLAPFLRTSSPLYSPAQKRFILRRVQFLKETDLLLAVSDSLRRQAIEALQISPERVVTIGAGIDKGRCERRPSLDARAKLAARYDLRQRFVLYVGAVEPSNLEKLIAAFALIPQEIRLTHRLVIISQVARADQKRLSDTARKHGLDTGEIVCFDHIPTDDVRLFHAACAVIVFPFFDDASEASALEAMAEGTPIIAPNCTAVLDIIDRKDALFDPQQPRELANLMARILSTPGFRQCLKAWAFERAELLTWGPSARKALRAFEELHAERKDDNRASTRGGVQIKPLLAFMSQLLPAETGKGRPYAEFLPHLGRYYDVVCIVDQPIVPNSCIPGEFSIQDTKWFEANAARFERILYHIGNSPECKYMFTLLEREPGVVVLHDFHLGGVLNWMEENDYANGSFTRALYDSHGFAALKEDRVHGRERSIRVFPCTAAVLRTSVGVIVQDDKIVELARAWYGKKGLPAIRCVPALQEESQHIVPVSSVDFGQIAALYRNFIEDAYATSALGREKNLIQAIASVPAPVQPSDADLENVAAAIASNRERFGQPQILVDVTILASQDARTGIQRVTRGILMALITDPPPGYRV